MSAFNWRLCIDLWMADVIKIGLFGHGGGGVGIEYSTSLKPSSLLSGVLMYFENVPELFSKPCLCYTGPRCHVKCVLKSQVLNLFFLSLLSFFSNPGCARLMVMV